MPKPKDSGDPLKLMVLADAYHAYDVPWLEKPVSYFGIGLQQDGDRAVERSVT
jgi:hypothetical protein